MLKCANEDMTSCNLSLFLSVEVEFLLWQLRFFFTMNKLCAITGSLIFALSFWVRIFLLLLV